MFTQSDWEHENALNNTRVLVKLSWEVIPPFSTSQVFRPSVQVSISNNDSKSMTLPAVVKYANKYNMKINIFLGNLYIEYADQYITITPQHLFFIYLSQVLTYCIFLYWWQDWIKWNNISRGLQLKVN